MGRVSCSEGGWRATGDRDTGLEVDDCDAFAAILGISVTEHADKRMVTEGSLDRRTQDSSAFSVDDSNSVVPRQCCLLEVVVDGFDSLLGAHSVNPELVTNLGADAGPLRHHYRRLRFSLRLHCSAS